MTGNALNRMVIAALALIGALIAVYTLMYSMGFLGQLACGTGGCETVQLWAKDQGLPVPAAGAIGYTALLITALLGLQPAFANLSLRTQLANCFASRPASVP